MKNDPSRGRHVGRDDRNRTDGRGGSDPEGRPSYFDAGGGGTIEIGVFDGGTALGGAAGALYPSRNGTGGGAAGAW
jgi:hypothetical protein